MAFKDKIISNKGQENKNNMKGVIPTWAYAFLATLKQKPTAIKKAPYKGGFLNKRLQQ